MACNQRDSLLEAEKSQDCGVEFLNFHIDTFRYHDFLPECKTATEKFDVKIEEL